MNKIKVLHLVDNWPNELWINSGIFYKKLIYNLEKNEELLLTKMVILKYNSYPFIKLALFKRKPHFLIPFFYKMSFVNYHNLKFIFYPSLSRKLFSQSIQLLKIFTLKKMMKLIQKNEISMIHAHNAIPSGYVAMEMKKKTGIQYIVHIHGRDVQEYNSFNKVEKEIIKDIFINADGIICNSSKTQELLLTIIVRHKNVITMPFGIEHKTANYLKKNDTIKLVSVCNLIPVKSIDVVLKAIGILKNKYELEYHIIGDGPEFYKLTNLAIELKLNQVIKFFGAISNEKVMRILSQYDIFVLPSINEAFGNVYLEALSAGLPCIAVEEQGSRDIDPDSQAILYVKPSNEIDLAEKIETLITNIDLRQKMGLNGIKIIKERYNWGKITDSYISFYKRIKYF